MGAIASPNDHEGVGASQNMFRPYDGQSTRQAKKAPTRRASIASKRSNTRRGLHGEQTHGRAARGRQGKGTVSRRCSMVQTPGSKFRGSSVKRSTHGKLPGHRRGLKSTNFGDDQDRLMVSQSNINLTAQVADQSAVEIGPDSTRFVYPSYNPYGDYGDGDTGRYTGTKTNGKAVRASVFDVQEYRALVKNPIPVPARPDLPG